MPDERSWTARLRAETPLTASVRHLTFAVDAPEGFHWLPGQHVEVFAADAPSERFAYSLANAEQRSAPGRFELAVRRDGSAHPIERLRIGDSLCVGAPRGSFVRSATNPEPAVFIAIGTGLAPLRAMIQSALSTPTAPELLLLLGCRSEADLLWRSELTELTSDPRFTFVPTLSQPSVEWQGRRGYVQAHLADFEARLRRAEVFVCGSSAMVRELDARLRELGVPPERVFVEGY